MNYVMNVCALLGVVIGIFFTFCSITSFFALFMVKSIREISPESANEILRSYGLKNKGIWFGLMGIFSLVLSVAYILL